jgi:CheY-like chemotaxis protein
MQRIILADESEDFRLALTELLEDRYEVVCCADGTEALEQLRAEKTDLIVLDLTIPGLDGMGLLKIIRHEGLAAAVIVTGRLFSDYTAEVLNRCRVDYAVQKPCSMKSLAERIDELCGNLAEAECTFVPADAVEGILLSLGMPKHRLGFRYVRELILMTCQNPDLQITKTAYPEVAKRHGSTSESVEKAVRVVIHAAWDSRNDTAWRRYFPVSPKGQIPRPTNAEFVACIASEIAARAMRSAKGG